MRFLLTLEVLAIAICCLGTAAVGAVTIAFDRHFRDTVEKTLSRHPVCSTHATLAREDCHSSSFDPTLPHSIVSDALNPGTDDAFLPHNAYRQAKCCVRRAAITCLHHALNTTALVKEGKRNDICAEARKELAPLLAEVVSEQSAIRSSCRGEFEHGTGWYCDQLPKPMLDCNQRQSINYQLCLGAMADQLTHQQYRSLEQLPPVKTGALNATEQVHCCAYWRYWQCRARPVLLYPECAGEPRLDFFRSQWAPMVAHFKGSACAADMASCGERHVFSDRLIHQLEVEVSKQVDEQQE